MDSLKQDCEFVFNATEDADGLRHISGTGRAEYIKADALERDNELKQVIITTKPGNTPVIWSLNYMDTCLRKTLAAIHQAWAYEWLASSKEPGATERDGVRVETNGGELDNRVVTVSLVSFNSDGSSASENTVESTPASCGVAVVTGVGNDRLNVRDSPGKTAEVVTKLPEGTTITLLCATESQDGIVWNKIEAVVQERKISGWVSAEYLQIKK
jgi:Bacterial SH3 domain